MAHRLLQLFDPLKEVTYCVLGDDQSGHCWGEVEQGLKGRRQDLPNLHLCVDRAEAIPCWLEAGVDCLTQPLTTLKGTHIGAGVVDVYGAAEDGLKGR